MIVQRISSAPHLMLPKMARAPQHNDASKTHIRAVGGVVYRWHMGRLELLLIRKRHGYWTLPKGKLKKHESDSDGLIRELREETGIGGDIEQCVQQVRYCIEKKGKLRDKTVTYYLVCAEQGELCPGVHEGIELLRWFPIQAALRRLRRARLRWIVRSARSMLMDD